MSTCPTCGKAALSEWPHQHTPRRREDGWEELRPIPIPRLLLASLISFAIAAPSNEASSEVRNGVVADARLLAAARGEPVGDPYSAGIVVDEIGTPGPLAARGEPPEPGPAINVERNPSAEPYYLPMDCPVCGRRRMEWDGKVLSCEKCTSSSEWDGFDKERYARQEPAINVERLARAIAEDDDLDDSQYWEWGKCTARELSAAFVERYDRLGSE